MSANNIPDVQQLEIVTNNARVSADFQDSEQVARVRLVSGSPVDVFKQAEELLQSKYRLVSVPLPPNIPLMRAKYRSILLERSEKQYDASGIIALEKALDCMKTQRAISEHAGSGTDEDFAMIDEDLLRRAIRDRELGIELDRQLKND